MRSKGKTLVAPIASSLKSIFQSHLVSTLLLVSGLSILCVGLAYQLGRVLSVALPQLTEGPAKSSSLVTKPKSGLHRTQACGSVVDLVQWSEQKMGRKNVLQGSRNKAISNFLDGIDSRKILLTASEVESFRVAAKNSWSTLSESGNCDFFQRWHAEHVQKIKNRFYAGLEKVSFESKASADPAASTTKKPSDVQYDDWASDERVLEGRIVEVATARLKTSPPQLFAVYQNDMIAMASDSMEDVLEGLEMPVSELLAKSILKATDKYSNFFSAEEFQDFYADLSGGASGLGIRVRKVPAGIFIEKVLKDSAAERTGNVFAGDIITKIDGVSVAKVPFQRAKQLLKGNEGSRITLSLKRNHKSVSVSMQRSPFALEDSAVSGKWIQSKGKAVAMVHIPSFYGRGGMGFGGNEKSSSEDVEAVLEHLYSQGDPSAPLVLDLRGNPGGYLEESVSVGSLFVGSQPIVGVSEQNNTRVLREEGAMPIRPEGPMIILVDEDTASASEVLAGALKDYQKAIVVGTPTTYGKGSVQKLFHLSDPILQLGLTDNIGTGVVKLTTSTFYSPLGHTPANGGVKSQLVIKSAQEKFESASEVPDLAPLIDESVLSMIRSNEQQVAQRIALLKEKSQERKSSGEATSKGEDPELSEAIAIAIDAASDSAPIVQ